MKNKTKNTMYPGQIFNGLVVVKQIDDRKSLFKCLWVDDSGSECGIEFADSIYRVRNGYKKSCGCIYDDRKKTLLKTSKEVEKEAIDYLAYTAPWFTVPAFNCR